MFSSRSRYSVRLPLLIASPVSPEGVPRQKEGEIGILFIFRYFYTWGVNYRGGGE